MPGGTDAVASGGRCGCQEADAVARGEADATRLLAEVDTVAKGERGHTRLLAEAEAEAVSRGAQTWGIHK